MLRVAMPRLPLAICALLALAGCRGDDDPPTPPSPEAAPVGHNTASPGAETPPQERAAALGPATAERDNDGPRPPDEPPADVTEIAALPAGLPDDGVFGDLDGEVTLTLPAWLPRHAPTLAVDTRHGTATLLLDGSPVKTYPLKPASDTPPKPASDTPLTFAALPLRAVDRDELAALGAAPPVVDAAKAQLPDRDDDGIPDSIDTMLGARKVALNGAAYQEGYEKLPYPGGDVSREMGVCTDVVVRALRNAGLDLQAALYKDMTATPARYGLEAGRRADPSIEHRRVRRLLPWFRAHLAELPPTFDGDATGRDAWLPGDVVFMDTIASRKGPDHVGLVSDTTDALGRPQIVNNWTYGFHTSDMPLLTFVPVTHRFRLGVER